MASEWGRMEKINMRYESKIVEEELERQKFVLMAELAFYDGCEIIFMTGDERIDDCFDNIDEAIAHMRDVNYSHIKNGNKLFDELQLRANVYDYRCRLIAEL